MTAPQSKAQQKQSAKNLVLFEKGSKRAREAGRKGGQTRSKNALAKRALTTELTETLQQLQKGFKREQLGPTAAALAISLIIRAETGEIEITGKDLPEMLKVLVEVVRLEAGQATSLTAVGHVSDVSVMEQLREMRSGTDVVDVCEGEGLRNPSFDPD